MTISGELQKYLFKCSFAHDSLLEFMKLTWHSNDCLKVGRHTREITDRLDRAIEDYKNGKPTYLMVTVPFRHGKSQIISRSFPPYFFGHFPNAEVLLATYGQDLSDQLSRDARSVIKTKEFADIFHREKITLSRESASVKVWQLTGYSGKFQAVGMEGGATGRGANLLIIDDYLKGRAAAESETVRNSQWQAFTGDLMTRLAPVHIVVILATPWHVDDIIGRIKAKINQERKEYDPEFPPFECMKFPAIATNGDYLFPERFPPEWYKRQAATLGTYQRAALLQCEPVTRGGNMLKTDNIIIEEVFPEGLRFFRFWDLASTQKERAKDDPDYTSGALAAVKKIGGINHLYVANVKFCQMEAPGRNKLILQTAEEDGASVVIGVESVAGYKDTYTTVRDILKGRFSVRKITVQNDKVVRTAEIEPIFENGNVHFLRGGWNSPVIEQLSEFPSGSHDDHVDAITGAFAMALSANSPSPFIFAG